jgi:hypothetical protein
VIHGFPTDLEVGSDVDEDERRGLGGDAHGVSGLSAAPWAQGGRRPAVPGGAALLHGGERALAGVARALRELKHGVEALRRARQGGSLRGVLRYAGRHEFVGSSDPDVRLDHRPRPCLGSRCKRGQQGRALGCSHSGFTTKIHAKSDASGALIGFDLTSEEKGDALHFAVLLDIGPDITPRALIGDTGYSSKANRALARGIAPVISQKDKPAFFAKTLYKARGRIEQGIGILKRFKRVAPAARRQPKTSGPLSASLLAYA